MTMRSGAVRALLAAASVGAVLLPSVPALAQDVSAENQFRERFRRLDTDGDGQLSREQVGRGFPALSARFGELDVNQDERLSLKEIEAASGASSARPAAKYFRHKDAIDAANRRAPANVYQPSDTRRDFFYRDLMRGAPGPATEQTPASPAR